MNVDHEHTRPRAGPVLGGALAAALALAWGRAAYAHGPGSLPGVLTGWGVIAASTAAGWAFYRAALAGGRPLLWGLLLQLMRTGAVLLLIVAVHEMGPPWFEPFVETAILSYVCGMAAEVLLLYHSSPT